MAPPIGDDAHDGQVEVRFADGMPGGEGLTDRTQPGEALIPDRRTGLAVVEALSGLKGQPDSGALTVTRHVTLGTGAVEQ
ncbi:hypothetical protein GCM10023223_29230 [Stackebrandtia albiflava]